MKTMTVTINITFDDEPNTSNGSPVNQSVFPPKSEFNFLSSLTKEPWSNLSDKNITADRKTATSTNIITFPSCELLRRHHVSSGK
ncbi:hypothetical protein [Polynucleobacter acidiphobus]|uniref:hypothetical protein n=1 Tax=Polynucleobacter acidiphobus TaxID=556053 RepID=UPI00131EE34A|nr:hypothetical protein [Polynucleobacter acidiphobus]